MDDTHVKTLSVTGSIASVVALYLFVGMVFPEGMNICSIDAGSLGSVVTVEGSVSEVLHTNGNVFFTLADGGCEIKVVLWSDVVSALSMNGLDAASIGVNDTISVTGVVQSGSGRLQLVPVRPSVSLTG